MSANEVLQQVQALPPRERRKFFQRVHELETTIDAQPNGKRKRPSRSPDASAHYAAVKTAKTLPSTPIAIRRHPYDPYNPKVRARRTKLIEGLNSRHNPKIADAEAALEKIIDEMYPETKLPD